MGSAHHRVARHGRARSHRRRQGSDQGTDNSRVGIDANMGFHNKVSLVARLGLAHIRNALTTVVPRRGWRGHDRRINDDAFEKPRPLPRREGINGGEDAPGQLVLLLQAMELEPGRDTHAGSRDRPIHESPDGPTVVEGVCDAFVGKTEALNLLLGGKLKFVNLACIIKCLLTFNAQLLANTASL